MSAKKIDPRSILAKPTVCCNCGSNVRFVNNSEIYGKEYGEWPWAYLCTGVDCKSYIGCHKGTEEVLGTLANASIRKWRKEAHSAFDHIWKDRHMSRTDAYQWLADKLDIERWRCHIGWFDESYCKQVVKVSVAYLRDNRNDLHVESSQTALGLAMSEAKDTLAKSSKIKISK